MPTPFYHLSVAYELLEHPDLHTGIRTLLTENKAPFLLGKTAPDVQVVSGQPRESTHFYKLPPEGKRPAEERMLSAYPHLKQAAEMAPAQAAFIAGYLCHLQADETWLWDLFLPIFGPEAEWDDFWQRLFLHNVLRSYLDREVLANLPEETGDCLTKTEPQAWLPFVDDAHLRTWRDYVAEQFGPGAVTRTIEVFAGRQGLSAQIFLDLMNSEARMDAEVFVHLPRERLKSYRQDLVEQNLQLLAKYLSAIPESTP